MIGVIISAIVPNQKYFPWIWQIFLYIGVGCCVSFILVTICCHVVVLIVSARRKSAMHLYGRLMRTIVMRERRIATTVGLILLLLCFTYLPVLAAPFIPHSLGYPFEDQPPFQAIGVWAGGGGGGCSPLKIWVTFFGQQEKFGQSQFLKTFACVCACCCCFFSKKDISILN